jgi:hypothetical protein
LLEGLRRWIPGLHERKVANGLYDIAFTRWHVRLCEEISRHIPLVVLDGNDARMEG